MEWISWRSKSNVFFNFAETFFFFWHKWCLLLFKADFVISLIQHIILLSNLTSVFVLRINSLTTTRIIVRYGTTSQRRNMEGGVWVGGIHPPTTELTYGAVLFKHFLFFVSDYPWKFESSFGVLTVNSS